MSTKPRLISGMKPTGTPHIGNYFGALRQWVDLQNADAHECFFMIADYHALNFIQDASKMREYSQELLRTLLAIGIDPSKVTIFKQSDISEHTELTWIFNTITTMPYLMRAHAFKDAEVKGSEVSVGTFDYPILMSADILVYDAQLVPVGQDQKQHIEYARDTAEKFNRVFGDTFTLPEPYILPEVAIVPGTDGQKMSKSYGNTIPLFASRSDLEKAVMSIVTDSRGSPQADSMDSTSSPQGRHRPENVYAIHALIKDKESLDALYEEHKGKYKALKDALIKDLEAFIAPMREKYQSLTDEAELAQILEQGARSAKEKAGAKMSAVRKAIGTSL